MAHVALKKLTIRSCRSIVDKTEVVLPEHGLVLIKGMNADTKGSSGSGKTSLLLGLAFAFGYSPFPATALQSWHTDEPLEVEVVFDTKEGEVVLRRGAKTSLTVDGKTIKGSVKAVEEKLAQLIGLPPNLLEALTYRGQKQRSLFLSMSDSDKKDFLATVLGLDRIEEEAEKASQTAKELESSLKIKQATYENLNAMLQEMKQQLKEPVQEDETEHQEAIRTTEEEVEALKAVLSDLQAKTSALQDEIQAAKGVVAAKYSDEVLALRLKMEEASNETLPEVDSSKMRQLKTIYEELKRRFAEAKDADETRRKEHEQTKLGLEKQLAEAKAAAESLKDSTARLNEAHARIKELDEAKCPTCKREWADSQEEKDRAIQELAALQARHDLANEKRQSIVDIMQKVQYLPEFKPDSSIKQFEDALRQLESTMVTETMKMQQFEQEFARAVADKVQGIKARLLELQETATEEVNTIVHGKLDLLRKLQAEEKATSSEVNAAEGRLVVSQVALNDLRFRNRSAVSVYHTLLEQVAAAEKKASEAKQEFDSVKEKYQTEADFAQLLGREGFLGTIFDEVLAEIAQETNAILATVPNTSAVSMSFRTESITQKGTVKKSITPVIAVSGHEAPFASGLSGGMQTALELAVDLAIATVVGRRTGAAPGWLILDEAFEGLGVVEKECCLDILSKFATNRMVMVVDHDNQFKEMFKQTISVECSNGRTTVR